MITGYFSAYPDSIPAWALGTTIRVNSSSGSYISLDLPKTEDINTEIRISLQDAYTGKSVPVDLSFKYITHEKFAVIIFKNLEVIAFLSRFKFLELFFVLIVRGPEPTRRQMSPHVQNVKVRKSYLKKGFRKRKERRIERSNSRL